MKLRQLATNMTLLEFGRDNELLFSYETPVAGRNKNGYFRTAERYSVTTSRHINKYLAGRKAEEVPQVMIDLFAAVEM
jgi:hypothetical protein